MPLLVTSASGANGNGFGALLAFELDGTFRGPFIEDDRIGDPRGLAADPSLLSKGKAEFRKPRGLRFAPNGVLYCVARDEVVGFDFASGVCLGAIEAV